MKKIIFLSLSILWVFLAKTYGSDNNGNGLYLLIEDPDLRPIEVFSLTKNPVFNQLLEVYEVYVFKKAYPELQANDYVIKSSNDEKLKEELLLKFEESFSTVIVRGYGLHIIIENSDLLPIEEKQFFFTKNQEFNQLLKTYEVNVFLQLGPTSISEFAQKFYLIKSPYQDELKKELLLKYSEGIPLVEEAPGEPIADFIGIEYADNNIPYIKDGILFWGSANKSPVKINLYSLNGVKIKEIYSVTDEYSLKNNVSVPVLYEIIIGNKRYTGKYIFN